MNAADRAVEVLAATDVISPVLAAIQDVVNGPSHTFLIPYNCGWSGYEIASLLRSQGIETWGHMIVNRMIMITVRLPQARWAWGILAREGIPLIQ